ncbi:glycerophosphoryl diester phosphodiesterase [Sinosporangium album]|uniref:Glycerophosphoryl diester phosphodiesterase n=1 Tax=Sinosporangium album TaxID=504805 RepID=A0A1G8AB50_9ACTN|nr:glycerophosphodiester phosphodiesterase family protein [Sinosporangium album]SDH17580.1 glycerophosphoryl diester phosphodiesterase [Sinosporangium album]
MFRSIGLILSILVTAFAPALPSAAATATAPPTIISVAHRGASAYAPENTIAAFKLARQQRADMFEIDIQMTKDQQLVLMHDMTLTRTTNVEEVFPDRSPWKVSDFTLEEIRTLDAGSWLGEQFKGEPVPTLGDTLRAMNGSPMDLLLEVKAPELYPGIEARTAGELERHRSWLRPNRLVVQSFNWDSMRTFHEVMPDVPIGLLGTPQAARLVELATFADQINPHYSTLSAEYVRQVHDLNMEVFTWTVDDPQTMRHVITLEVDGVITNKPDVLRAELSV